MSGVKSVRVVRRFTLNGTIDGHDPIGVVFRIVPFEGPAFRLTVVSVNWGRGYAAGEFRANVLRVLERTKEAQYLVILVQELDEADAADEHRQLAEELKPGTIRVQWHTREPILVGPGARVVRRSRRTMTMDEGLKIGAPKGTGPRRYFTSCLAEIGGVTIAFGNQHPHRNLPNRAVRAARARGERVTRAEVGDLVAQAALTIYGGDMNDTRYPKAHPREKTAMTRGLDTIRYVVG